MDKTITKQNLLTKLILVATVFSILVIALGAYTRLVHAGLGCPDWPLCYGHLWAPDSSSEVAQANLKYPQAQVDLDKTWPEMTHRYLASSLGLLCIAILWLSIQVRKTHPDFPVKHASGLLAFIILQGLFGMWTVTLKLWPQVVTLHLLGGFATFCLLLLLYLRVRKVPIDFVSSNSGRMVARLSLVIVVIQVMLGGWLTSNYAAMACIELPFCPIGQLNAQDFAQGFNFLQQIGPNYLGGQLDGGARIAIHAMHRYGALVCVIVLILLVGILVRSRYWLLAIPLALLTVIQVGLGVANVYYSLPLFNAVAHNVTGAILVGCLVWVNYHLNRVK